MYNSSFIFNDSVATICAREFVDLGVNLNMTLLDLFSICLISWIYAPIHDRSWLSDKHFFIVVRESPSMMIRGHSCSTPIWTAFRHAIALAAKADVISWWISEQLSKTIPSVFLATTHEADCWWVWIIGIIKINFDELARWLGPSFMFLFSYWLCFFKTIKFSKIAQRPQQKSLFWHLLSWPGGQGTFWRYDRLFHSFLHIRDSLCYWLVFDVLYSPS